MNFDSVDFDKADIREDLKLVKLILNGEHSDLTYSVKNNDFSNPVSFQYGNTHIWQIRSGYQIADLIDGKFCNHRPTNLDLLSAIELAKKNSTIQ